mmetsp:Transcript_8532/g.24479  ORF Transcript_8532/g.24479 Transcript_8532/m.24479 type:complete len:281 (+) Transcript_8532:912-1754(+)
MAEGGFRHVPQPVGLLVAILIHVEVQRQPPLRCQGEDPVQQLCPVAVARRPVVVVLPAELRAADGTAQHAPGRLDGVRQVGRRGGIPEVAEHHQAHPLQIYAAHPPPLEFVEDGPREVHLLGHEVDQMGPQSGGPVGIGRSEAELHAALEVLVVPEGEVARSALVGPAEGARGVAAAVAGVALVDVGVEVHKGGEHHPAPHIGADLQAQPLRGPAGAGLQAGYAARLYVDVQQHEAVLVRLGDGAREAVDKRQRDCGIAYHKGAAGGQAVRKMLHGRVDD